MLIVLTTLVFVLAFAFMGLISSTLSGIYVAAVYRYAAEGKASGFFSEEMVRGAFRPEWGVGAGWVMVGEAIAALPLPNQTLGSVQELLCNGQSSHDGCI